MPLRFRLIPQDARFFDLFNRGADNILKAAHLLLDILERDEDIDRKARHLEDIEHTGDEITHEVFRALNRAFVTPLDREDISYLASALDDMVDWIEEAGRRIRLYRITEIPPLAQQLGHVIVDQAEQISRVMPLLEAGKFAEELECAIHEIHRLENEADDLLAEALATLYDGVTEVPQLILAMRWGDIYQILEDTTDKGEEVAVALNSITLKFA
jgi:predicted phosphate transport protein (TIGR00153 family)